MDDALQGIEMEIAMFARRMEFARGTKDAVARLDRSAYLLLSSLRNRGMATVGELADLHQLDISTVSRQIAPLIHQGLIEREQSPADKRVSVLRMTSAGLDAWNEVRRARHELYAELLNDWSDEERTQFYHLLHRLNERIRQHQQSRLSDV